MNGNLFDYLKPVDEPGDKTYSAGVQETESNRLAMKKEQEALKTLAMKKQIDLERENQEHLLEILQKDTPEAAVYRALLLQQLQNTNKLKKEDEDKKPGVVRSVAGWIGNTALGTAKFMGRLGLRYLMFELLRKAPSIYAKGAKATWEDWLDENGVAKSAELAEQQDSRTAGISGDIIKRKVDFKDLTDDQKKATIKYAQEATGEDILDTTKANFALKSVYKDANDEYMDALPEGADAADYKKEWAMMLNTGGDKGRSIPFAKSIVGDDMYNSMFKKGTVKTLITPEDNWFTGNSSLRAFDNNYTHIADLRGTQKRSIDDYADAYNPDPLPPAKKTRVDILEDDALEDREISDQYNVIDQNIDDFLGNIKVPGWFNKAHFDIEPSKVNKLVDQVLNMKGERVDHRKLFEATNPNTNNGIGQEDLKSFIHEAIEAKVREKSPAEQLKIYETLVKKYNKKGVGAMPWFEDPYLDTDFKTGKKNYNTGNIAKNTVATGLAATGVALGVKSALAASAAAAPATMGLSLVAPIALLGTAYILHAFGN